MKKPVKPTVAEKIVEIVFVQPAVEEDENRRPVRTHEVTGRPVRIRESSAERWVNRGKAMYRADYVAMQTENDAAAATAAEKAARRQALAPEPTSQTDPASVQDPVGGGDSGDAPPPATEPGDPGGAAEDPKETDDVDADADAQPGARNGAGSPTGSRKRR